MVVVVVVVGGGANSFGIDPFSGHFQQSTLKEMNLQICSLPCKNGGKSTNCIVLLI